MRRMQVMLGRALAGLLVAAMLAGCAAGDGGDAVDGLAEGAPVLEATATTGVIRGVVVDEAIRPIANVSVTARGPDGAERSASTDVDGFFGLSGLAPGTWFLTSEKVAYTSTQQSVEVVAGVSEPPVTKLQVTFVPGEVPFYTEVKVEAFVQCIIPGANMCAIINLYPCAVANYCEPIVDDTSFIVLYDHLVSLARTPDWLQTEVVWESTQSVSPALAVRYSSYAPEDGAGLDERQDRVAGESPLVYRMDQANLTEWDVGIEAGITHEFFGHTEALSPVGSLGIVVNQRVTFFSHTFYGYLPPAEWRFSSEPVPQPPQ